MSGAGNREEILRHLDTYGMIDKDAESVRRPPPARGRYRRKKKTIRRVVDLHGKSADAARLLLQRIVPQCRANGVGELLIIHGWGSRSDPAQGPVLKNLVCSLLGTELKPFVRSFAAALPKEGGEGATLVRMG